MVFNDIQCQVSFIDFVLTPLPLHLYLTHLHRPALACIPLDASHCSSKDDALTSHRRESGRAMLSISRLMKGFPALTEDVGKDIDQQEDT